MSFTSNTYKRKTEKAEKPAKSAKTKRKIQTPGFIRSIVLFFKDERLHKLIGLFLLLSAIYLVIAFSSFLFTWKRDHDKVSGSWTELLASTDVMVDNWLGKIGAIVSHQFIHNGFGIASFLFVLLFFITGFRILFKIKLLPTGTTFRHSLFLIVWLSATFSYFFADSYSYLGGAFGFWLDNWLNGIIGTVGTGFLLAFVMIGYLVLTFNFSFKIPGNALDFINPNKTATTSSPDTNEGVENDEVNDVRNSEFNTNRIDLTQDDNEDEEAETPSLEEETLELEMGSTTEEEVFREGEEENTAAIQDSDNIEENDPTELFPVSTTSEEEKSDDEDVAFSFEKGEDELNTDDNEDGDEEEMIEFDPTLELSSYKMPSFELLVEHGDDEIKINKDELEANKNRIVDTLNNYNIQISKIKATIGPTVTLYEIIPAAGVRISKIKNLEDDIALSLSALGIRIIAPIPGKGTIGIEVPNQNPEVVSMKSILSSEKFQNTKMELPIGLGKTISNETFITDLAKMPHLLMAGATGQGKSVGLNVILASLLYKKHPSQVKFVLVDPKKVELTLFRQIERHFLAKLPGEEEPIITDTKKVVNTLNSLCVEMDERYELLKEAMVRNIKEYNTKFVARKLNPKKGHRYLPYIVLVVDEFADLIMTAGKEVETPIARLAQLARAIGIHLIIATQRPSVNIITGVIKANFPARIAFRVTSKVDSRTILDSGGAEQLIGRGDMLLSLGSDLKRIQCAFIDTPEVEKITEFIGSQRGYPEAHLLPEFVSEEGGGGSGEINPDERDDLFEDAARIIVQHQQGSASLLQRRLKLGYNRAGRIIDQLEAAGIIGPFEGSKARQVLIPDETTLEQFLNNDNSKSEQEL